MCEHSAAIAALLKGSDILIFSFKGLVAPVGEVKSDLTDGSQEISDYITDCQ